jgi:hypothetical protein
VAVRSRSELTSVRAVRTYLLEQKQALERDVWGAADWEAFLRMSGEYRAVCDTLDEMGVEGAEED